MIFIIANSHCIRISGIGNNTCMYIPKRFSFAIKKFTMLDTLQEVHLKHISYWYAFGFYVFLKKKNKIIINCNSLFLSTL